MKKILLLAVVVLMFVGVKAQTTHSIIAGPMVGHVEFRTAIIWAQFKADVRQAYIVFAQKGLDLMKGEQANFELQGGSFNTGKALLAGLSPATTYQYGIYVDNKKQLLAKGEITTQALWQWRTDAPDFNFITGSCAYINEPVFDRPGKPYGGDSSIFEAMAKEKSSFMLWLGDNWYTREVDYYSEWGLNYRAAKDRSTKVLQPLLKAMPNYAIWDDHDYGPNDADKSYVLKESGRKTFANFWANPSYGHNNQGIYTKFTWNDIDVFMLDDRWWRSNDDMADSVDGKPNAEKQMFGKQQLDWLKNALLQSKSNGNITFRIIATGSQVLNPGSTADAFRKFSAEYYELMAFISSAKINGVVFLTGDRHHSEIIKVNNQGSYPLYDITASPLTAGTHKFGGIEQNNPFRVVGVDQLQNFARVSFSGKKRDRKMTVEFVGVKGEKLAEWSTSIKDLTAPK
jgi:alkaline phosphatase D